MQILRDNGIRAQIEKYPPNAWYVVVAADADPVMIAGLARSAGRSVRRVPTFQELAAKFDDTSI